MFSTKLNSYKKALLKPEYNFNLIFKMNNIVLKTFFITKLE